MRSGSSWSLARRILALQAVTLVVVLGGLLVAVLIDSDAQTERATGERVAAIASTVAQSPNVIAAVTGDYPAGQEITAPSAAIQPFATAVGTSTGADFVVIMTPDGVRYTHPDPTQVGGTYLGSRTPRWRAGWASRRTPARWVRRSGRSHRCTTPRARSLPWPRLG